MKEICRICARELCGNQRRWIFHTTTKLNLQVLLSHVLGKDVSRDGKGEFACSKCAFMLDRIYRFDTVIARIEALSIERLQKLLLEKERLKFCIASMYRKNNDDPSTEAKVGNGTVDMSSLPDVRYTALLQEDFAYSGFECWAENEDQTQEAHSCHTSEGPGNRPRRCRGCAALRVADSDYEAICKVPRKVARSISYGASTRWSTSICTEEPALSEVGPPDLSSTKGPADGESMEEGTPGSSVESLDATVQASLPQQRDEEPERGSKELPKCDCCSDDQAIQYTCGHKLELALNMIKGFDYKPIQSPRGSKLPIPVKSSPPGTKPGHLMADGTSPNFLNRPVKSLSKTPVGCSPEISELQELWDDLYEDYLPLRFQNITEEPVQQQELNSNEATMTQPCVPDSHLAELQDKIEQTEAANKILQEKMNEMSCQLKSAREASQRQDCTIQNLSQSLKSRESETEELYQVIEGQKDTMTKLRDMLHRSQLGQLQPLEGGSPAQQQLALLDLQNALFCSQLEVQKFQRASRRKERLLEDAKRNLQFMEATAQGLEQQTEAARTHNQELRSALQQVQEDLRSRNKQLHLLEGTRCRETQAQEQSIHRLNHSLRQKDQLLQEYRELMQDQNNAERSLEANEMMLEKLRRRIQDRDVALERAIDEKFCALEEKEKELHKLQLAVRERDHDLERLRSVLSSNEATIQSMESLLQAKSLELEQLSVTCHNRQWLEGEMKRKFSHWQKEQEGIVQQLQTSLHDRNKEVEDLSATLFCKLGPGQSEVAKELCLRLQRKERMLQDLLGERNKQALEHEMEIQDLLQSMSTREKESQLALGKMVQALMERSAEVQTLRQHIGGKNLGFSTSQLAEATTSIGCHHEERPVQESMHENIKDKLNSGTAKGDTSTSRPQSGNMEASAELEKELIHAKEELELITRKERESRMELSALQSMVTVQAEELQVQAADMESLTRNMQIKEDLIKDLQMQLVDPEDIPAVQRLTQEVLILREKVASAESQGQETTENRRHQLLQVMEGLVEERAQLNEALQAERQLYSSLVESHTPLGSSERDQALQVELEGARVLRVRLEEALGRSLERLSKLETLAAFGGTAVGEDTEDTSTDFTDSIEEEATHSNTQQQSVKEALEKSLGTQETQHSNLTPPSPTRGEKNRDIEEEVLCPKAEIHQLLEQKRELKDLKAQLEEAGFSSVSHIRNTLLSLYLENAELKEQMGEAMSEGWEMEEDKEKEEEWRVEDARGALKEDSQCAEVRRVQGKLQNANTMISLLRDQLALNNKAGGKKLNAQLIISLTKEIDRLKKEVVWSPRDPSALGEQLQDRVSKGLYSGPQIIDLVSILDLKPKNDHQVNSQGLLSNNGSLEQSSLQGSTHHLRSQLEQCKQRYQDLQEKLLVSEATVQILASQLEQYQALFREPGVKQDSKQVQVDLQDLGYETCGRSENEAEREETTSPECEEHDVFSDTKLTEGLHSQHNSLGSPVTSSPLKKPLGNQKDFVDYGKSEDIAVLQQHISDLKARLKNSDKVIQNLKCRVRSSSITSDYASSLERPKKVKLKGDDPTSSPSHSLTDEDEGWQSDGMGVFSPPEMQAREDLEKLIQRVSLLEAQLPKSQMEGKLAVELKSATWPGKYDFLIQAQARELSHLRQKIREGRGVCHILTHNLRDIVKSFEDILRGTDIDYYLGQSFREQLVQGSQVAERLTKKLSTKDQGKADNPSNHEILALRLSKELQDKEKVIEVLQSKLDSRSLTPSSSHTFFDAHRPPSSTSFLSDEMEASSDTDVASECTQYEEDCADKAPPNLLDSIHHSSKNAAPSSKPSSATTCHGVKKKSSSIPATMPSSQKPKEASQAYAGLYFNSIPKPAGIHQPPLSSTPSIFLPFGPPPPAAPPLLDCCGTSVLSLAEAQQELQMLQKQLGESISPTTPTMPAPLPSNPAEVGSPHCLHTPHCTSEFHPLGISAELCRSANSGPLSKSGLWETIRPQKGTAFGDLSSNSAVCHPRSKLAGADLLEEHLSEIRNLRQRLEESICINDRLREQLEDRLNSATRAAGSSCSIHMPSLESVSQLGNENRNLLAEKQNLQAQLSHLSKEHSRELERLREALLASHTRLQELEATLERQKAEQWQMAEELKEKQQVILQFQEEKLSLQDKNNRLQHKIILLQQQSEENQRLIQSLQSELQVYVTLYGNSKQVLKASSWDIYRQGSLSSDLSTLVAEVRALRSQLEYSIQVNNSLRQQLEQKLEGSPGKAALSSSCMTQDFPATSPGNKWQFFQDSLSSPPVRDIDMNVPTSGYSTATSSTLDSETSPFQRTKELGLDVSPGKKTPSVLEGDAPDGSFANKHGRHMIGHIDDFSALKQQLLEGKLLVHKMVSLLQVTLNSPALQSTEILISGSIHQLWGKTKTLHQILEESDALLTMFWRAALPSTNRPTLQKKAEESMKGEILALKTKLSEQENLLKNTNECLKTTKLEKENLEQFIVKQLTRTHDVLKKARRNLEATSQRVPPVTQVM
ncbi:myomegalin isoform X2 [Notamacropus eugenii]|uniref:myomegalin isoform X2 n=1 Tax=Notamacropus eugenii TaxID=9315 RepID=UPI003B66E5D1